MKALTLTQPWASLVILGAKRIETRSWGTKYRGPLIVHAAKNFPSWAREQCREPFYMEVLAPWLSPPKEVRLPRGAILGVVLLVDCVNVVPPDLTIQERAFGDFGAGRWFWMLSQHRALIQPVLTKGALGLWEYTGNKEEASRE